MRATTQSAPLTCWRTACGSAASSPTLGETTGSTYSTQTCNTSRAVLKWSINYKKKVRYPGSEQVILKKLVLPAQKVFSYSTVVLRPPSNLTVMVGSDSNLWCYWNKSDPFCEENEIRYRVNNREWDVSQTRDAVQTR